METMGIRLLTFLFTAMAVTTRSAAAEGDPNPEEQGQQIAVQPQAEAPGMQPPQQQRNDDEASTSSGKA